MESEVLPAAPSNDPLENIVALIAELPTEGAVKELNRGRINGSVRKVIETMAVHKMEIVGAIAMMAKREHLAMSILEQHYNLEEIQNKLGMEMDWSKVKITLDVSQED